MSNRSTDERFLLRTMLDDAAAWTRIGINSMATGRYKDAAYEIDRLRKETARMTLCLQAVMADLADLLDADQFNNIEARVLAAGVPYPPLGTDPRRPPEPRDDAARLDWLRDNEASLRPHRESFGVDDPESEYSIWWNVVNGGKSISGHPLGDPRAAIDEAMQRASLTKGAEHG